MKKHEIYVLDYYICLLVSHAVPLFRKLNWIQGEVRGIDVDLKRHELFLDFLQRTVWEGERRAVITVVGTEPQLVILAKFFFGTEGAWGFWRETECSFVFVDPTGIEQPNLIDGVEFTWEAEEAPFFGYSHTDTKNRNIRKVLDLATQMFNRAAAI